MKNVFAGVDPGGTGGIGLLDSKRQFLAAWRWNKADPIYLYNKLLLFKDMIRIVYLEDVRIFPEKGSQRATQTQGLFVNQGIWRGWLIALGLPYLIIHPHTWQALCGLRSWAKLQNDNPAHPCPLSVARATWPSAPLEHKADDGKAAALLLASLAWRDHVEGKDRAAILAAAEEKRTVKKKKDRQAKKAVKALQF